MTTINRSRTGVATLLALSTIGLMIAGCQPTKQVTGSSVTPVGSFIPNPFLLRPGKSGEAALVYLNPDANLASYNRMILDPVTVMAGTGSSLEKASPEQRQALADTFHADIYNAVSQRCQMVTAPGPGTIRVRLALADAQVSDTSANTVATYIPQARTLDTLTSYAFNDGVGFFVGSATAEGYMTDANKGTLLWQGVDKRVGTNAVGSDTLKSWGDVDNAFKAWAAQFAKRMAELGICNNPSGRVSGPGAPGKEAIPVSGGTALYNSSALGSSGIMGSGSP